MPIEPMGPVIVGVDGTSAGTAAMDLPVPRRRIERPRPGMGTTRVLASAANPGSELAPCRARAGTLQTRHNP